VLQSLGFGELRFDGSRRDRRRLRREAALYYWQDFDPGYYRPASTFLQQRKPKPRRHQARKSSREGNRQAAGTADHRDLDRAAEPEDLRRQRILRGNADLDGHEVGHPTPMGVFSVIQKHKLHHSNIYSGAPMPYMQRITWSGVAMHAGVLPGYPASHGCIRMPMAFAMKMWNWTRMGARVVVTPGEMTPASFSHPLLATQKVVAQPTSAREPSPMHQLRPRRQSRER
jgi:lipoprotein-anchoring transpeptidase ErfK/SrfK